MSVNDYLKQELERYRHGNLRLQKENTRLRRVNHCLQARVDHLTQGIDVCPACCKNRKTIDGDKDHEQNRGSIQDFEKH